ncbi:VirB4 family type IV secretion system protein [Parapedobacter soli]|uniref:VirB4 family type IV secretion system protein n=1 Tax=Parapedobacter soli TaxID=416955 RepID=UPI0021C8DE57|nr:hypothetical protein [Parapedobacter soli]
MITAGQAYSILGVMGDMLLTKDGSVCVAYLVENPEPYSLDIHSLEKRHSAFHLALKDMPPDSFYHRQDVFVKDNYNPDIHDFPDTFISNAEKEHFRGREYLKHFCVLAFTICHLETLDKAYNQNPLKFKSSLSKSDLEKLDNFIDAVDSAISVIKNIEQTNIKRLDNDELKYYLFKFVNGFNEDNGVKDIKFEQRLRLGAATGSFFAVSDENFLPDTFDAFVTDNTIDSPNVTLNMARLEQLGIHLHANHVINQIISFPGNDLMKQELDQRILLHGQYRAFGSEIKYKYHKLEEFKNDILENDALLCRVHFNVMVWDEDETKLYEAEKKIKEVFVNKGYKYYMPSYEGLYNIFLGSVIGREKKLDHRYLFTADLNAALSFSINYSAYRDDPDGVLFTDRIFQIPRKVDLWNGGAKRIPARNGMVVASTGGGKSATTLNITQQFLEQGVKTIVVEFGSSFKTLAMLYPERSAHIAYRSDTNLGINPFHIENDSELTPEKVNTLTAIVLKYWRQRSVDTEANAVIALSKVIKEYYNRVRKNHSFPSFYNFVRDNISEVLKKLEVPEKYFDTESFLHICSEFMPGGMYENISAPADNTVDKIRNNDFIVFELTEIKKDPFLVSVIMTAIFDTVENKILSDRSTKGVLIFDEYAETQSLKDYFSGDDIHSTVAFAYQKLRKENGAIYTIIQSPVQLPDNEYTKGIIANTQLLYVLPTTETVYDQVIESFHIKNKAHIDLMRSIKFNFAAERPYNEVYIRFLDAYAVVHKLEFSREKFYAFQTDGETWKKIQDLYKEHGNMPDAIHALMMKNHEKINAKINATDGGGVVLN